MSLSTNLARLLLIILEEIFALSVSMQSGLTPFVHALVDQCVGKIVSQVVDTFLVLGRRLLQKKFHKFELAGLANLSPETAEEAKTLIPR